MATTAAGAVIVDPRPAAAPAIAEVYARYPHIGPVLPAIGYTSAQLDALRATIEHAGADVIVAATPMDIAALLSIVTPVVRAHYEFADAGDPTLGALVDAFLDRL